MTLPKGVTVLSVNIRHATTKIYIVGGPGSGKTTLSAKLAGITGLPCYELDSIAYAELGPGIPQRPDDELATEVARIRALEGWVVEGMYFGWSDPLIFAADLVVWLDPPWPIAVWRTIKRDVIAMLGANPRYPGWRRLWRMPPHVRRWYTRHPDDIRSHHDATGYARSTFEPYVDRLKDRMIRTSRISPNTVLETVDRRRLA